MNGDPDSRPRVRLLVCPLSLGHGCADLSAASLSAVLHSSSSSAAASGSRLRHRPGRAGLLQRRPGARVAEEMRGAADR